MPRQGSSKIETMADELERAATEFIQIREEYERVRIRFAAALERFMGVYRLASEVMDESHLDAWRDMHEAVQYTPLPLGEAVEAALRNQALFSAQWVLGRDEREYNPWLTIREIAEALEHGGYVFQKGSPIREVNAALINLKGIVKSGDDYRVQDADDILARVKMVHEEYGGEKESN